METICYCHDCENVNNSGFISNAKNVLWSEKCRDCEDILYSTNIRDRHYVVLNKLVSKDEYEDTIGRISETTTRMMKVRSANTTEDEISKLKQRIMSHYIG